MSMAPRWYVLCTLADRRYEIGGRHVKTIRRRDAVYEALAKA